MTDERPSILQLPTHSGLFYGGAWHEPDSGSYFDTFNPGTGQWLARVADANAKDIEHVIAAAGGGFLNWKRVPPLERAMLLRRVANVARDHAEELAVLDAADGGNPVREMIKDVTAGAAFIDFFAGLVTEMKGSSIPMGPQSINFSVREPLGVVARLTAFNHPFYFLASKLGAPLAAGNTVIIKPPPSAPLSSIRFAELIDGILPPGVFNLVNGGAAVGQTLARHPGVAAIAMIGSVPTGRSIMKTAADTLKKVVLELGGKNALIAFADCDADRVASAIVGGMNFTWCGQSCGSTSRAFVHSSIYADVVEKLKQKVPAFKPGLPTDFATTMGAIIDRKQHESVMRHIETAVREGAELICGGHIPKTAELANGLFIEPTIFAANSSMSIAREEIFGPVLALLKWEEEDLMLEAVNQVEYGLTCSIWTNNLQTAHRIAAEVQAGYVWINEVSKHFLGAPFGGYKQSGLGREEALEELLTFTQEKHIHIKLT